VAAPFPAVAVGLLLVGVLATVYGVISLSFRLATARHREVSPGSVEEGLVVVRGAATSPAAEDAVASGPSSEAVPGPDDADVLTGPVSGDPALLVECAVQVPADTDRGRGDGEWTTTSVAWEAAPVAVAGEDGAVRVDATFEEPFDFDGADATTTIAPGESVPDRLAAFLADLPETAVGGRPGPDGSGTGAGAGAGSDAGGESGPPSHAGELAGRRRFVERRVAPGDDLVVYGEARRDGSDAPPSSGASGSVAVGDPTGAGVFALSRGDDPGLRRAFVGSGAALGVGIGFTLVALVDLLDLL
jgi:hypothetical protein